MKRGTVVKEYGDSGPAQVVATKTSIRVKFTDTNVLYEIAKENAPENARTGNFFVSLSDDNTKIMGLRPLKGSEVVRFLRFVGPKGTPPAPKVNNKPGKNYKTGQEYKRSRLVFTAILEIIEGPNVGMNLILPLNYFEKGVGFTRADDGSLQVSGANQAAENLVGFLTAAGVWNTEYPYSDNVLPMIQEALLRANKSFKVNLDGGWITSCEPLEEKPTKKSKK